MLIAPIEPPDPVAKLPDAVARSDDLNLFPAAAPGAAAVGEVRPIAPSLAVLLAGHVLRDGEVVLLIAKPSIWYVPFTSLKFAAAVAMLAMAAKLWLPPNVAWYYVEAALFVIAGRLMWATLHWMGRLYVLTDQRVLRLAGVFAVDVYDCPLRRIASTRVVRNVRERLFRLGTIEIVPSDDRKPAGAWQTVPKPNDVHAAIREAIRKANEGGSFSGE